MKATRWLGLGVGVAALAALGWWGYSRVSEPELSFRTAKIERGSLQAAVSASGTVNPVTQVQVSSQVSGQIKELFVDFNSEVRSGQLIARLDPETFEYRVRQSGADVEAARASVLTAQANVQSALAQVTRSQVDFSEAQRDERRKQDLVAQNFISPAELDSVKSKTLALREAQNVAQAQVDVARAQAQNAMAIVKQREAQLAQARIDLERTQIRSPVDGIVIKRSVEVGQTVAASLQAPELFVIARNLSDMQVEAAIDEADISRVRDAQKVSFTIDAFPGRNFEGTVRQVRKAAVSAQNVVSYTVVVGFANPGSLMLPGMTANVRIITDTRDNVLKVANAALRVRIAGIEPAAAASERTGSAGVWSWLASARAQDAQRRPGALRERLVEGLKLSESQQHKLDALLAEMRPGFIAMRDVPEDQRTAARDGLMADFRARMNTFLTPSQRESYAQMQAQAPRDGVQPVANTGSTGGPGVAPPAPQLAQPAAPPVTDRTSSAPGLQAAQASSKPSASRPEGATAQDPVPPSSPGAAGPLREFRQRLIDDLSLTPAQVEQVDAVIAAQQPRFAELRNLAEADRAKARERILSDLRAMIGERLTLEQRARYQKLQAELAGRQSTRGRIYVLSADGKPRAVNVRLGVSDGVMTELIVAPNSPEAAVLVEGATVVTAVLSAGSGGAGAARSGTASPGPRFP